MKPPPFSYAAPTTLGEAVGLLTEHADAEARVLARGQSLIPLMNFRLAKPGYLIDLRNVAELSGIRREGEVLVVGAMTRMSELERSPEVALAAPLAAEAIGLLRTPRSGTAERSAAASPTPIPPPNCPPWRSPSAPSSWPRARPAPAGSRRPISCRGHSARPWARRYPDRDPAAGVARGARVRRVLPGSTRIFAVVAVATLVELDGDRILARGPGPYRARPHCDPRDRGRAGPGRRRAATPKPSARPPRPQSRAALPPMICMRAR